MQVDDDAMHATTTRHAIECDVQCWMCAHGMTVVLRLSDPSTGYTALTALSKSSVPLSNTDSIDVASELVHAKSSCTSDPIIKMSYDSNGDP